MEEGLSDFIRILKVTLLLSRSLGFLKFELIGFNV